MAKKINSVNTLKSDKQSCFIYADTCVGFINYFENLYISQNLEKIYIIKSPTDFGILNEIAKKAENKKYSVEYLLYPSDLNRLNGIILKELKIAVVNENICSNIFSCPAIVENIINFNDFYDGNKLNESKNKLLELMVKKEEYKNSAYKFFKAANELRENICEISKRYINHEKLNSSIERLTKKHVNEKRLHEFNESKNEYRFINAMSSIGNVELDTFEAEAKKIFYISNENGLGWHYTEKIAKKFDFACKVICPDALNPIKIKAIYLVNSKILFVIKNKIPGKIYNDKYNFININRFSSNELKKENKQKLRFLHKFYNAIISETVKHFKEIESTTSEIEKIYESSLDSNKKNEKNKYTEAIIKKILP